jgi:hypothetical protein
MLLIEGLKIEIDLIFRYGHLASFLYLWVCGVVRNGKTKKKQLILRELMEHGIFHL